MLDILVHVEVVAVSVLDSVAALNALECECVVVRRLDLELVNDAVNLERVEVAVR